MIKIPLLSTMLLFFVSLGSILAQSQPQNLEIPRLKQGENIIRHSSYSLSYNEEYEQANWVAYELTIQETVAKVKRSGKFISDPKVKTGTADNSDYLHSNFDRGHLAPARDMSWSAVAMQESFYLSNISPQVPTFNRGIWENLEEWVRKWAETYGSVHIATGPVLTKGLPVIGKNKVAIPAYFYKAILDYSSDERKAIAFLLPNSEQHTELKTYVISIDSLEKFTGIDFFPALPDEEENLLEKKSDPRKWFSPQSVKQQKSEPAVESKSSDVRYLPSQCIATTRKGSRCRNKTNNPSGRCHVHQ